MVKKGFSAVCILIAGLLISSCGKKTERQSQQQAMQEQARQQAIQDSIASAQARKEAQLAAQRERERMNKQEADSTTEHEPVDGGFPSSGDYALQVSSWRSQWKAQKELHKWRERGYTNAYLMKYGNEKTGDIWFRVRLGHLQNRSDGEQIGKEISSKYNIHFWIAHV